MSGQPSHGRRSEGRSSGSERLTISPEALRTAMAQACGERILRQVNDQLRERFRIHHTTIQLEHAECEVAHGCEPPASDEHLHTH